MKMLKDKGNSILVVEHDPAIIEEADYVVDIGPGAGTHGGEVLFGGTVIELKRSGDHYREIPYRACKQKTCSSETVRIPRDKGCPTPQPEEYFCQDTDGCNSVCVTGVAGSGKSSLVNNIFTRGAS